MFLKPFKFYQTISQKPTKNVQLAQFVNWNLGRLWKVQKSGADIFFFFLTCIDPLQKLKPCLWLSDIFFMSSLFLYTN